MSNANEEDPNSINKTLLNVGHAKHKVKGSLVSRSGKQFESIDHYIAESIVQNFYPKKNQDDFELLKNEEGVSPNFERSEEDESKPKSNDSFSKKIYQLNFIVCFSKFYSF